MSFKCSQCSNPQASGVKPVVVVLQTRAISYPVRYRNGVVIDRGGNGTAIVREGKLCKPCAAQQSVQRICLQARQNWLVWRKSQTANACRWAASPRRKI